MNRLCLILILAVMTQITFGGCTLDDPYDHPTSPYPVSFGEKLNGNLPDLVITEVTLDLTRMRYTCIFENQGTSAANLNVVSLQGFYSQDKVYQNGQDSPAGGTMLHGIPLGWMNPGESRSFSWVMAGSPGSDVCNWNYFLLILDWGERVAESDEDNTVATPLCFTSMEVALDVRPASCPNPLNPKSKGLLPVAILGSENFDVEEVDPTSIELHSAHPIRHHTADVATAPIPEQQGPNLKVVAFSGPATGTIGEALGYAVSLRIANTGNVDVTTGFPVGFYVSSDPVITTSDQLLIGGREFVASIGAGVEQSVPLYSGARIGNSSPTGDMYLGVIVDEFNTISETDESDNTGFSPIRISAGALAEESLVVRLTADMNHVESLAGDDCIQDGPDGFPDLMLKFRTLEIVAGLGDLVPGDIVELTITGRMLNGSDFTGTDRVVIVGGRPQGDPPDAVRASH